MIHKSDFEWRKLAKQFPTPFYIYDGRGIQERYQLLRTLLPKQLEIYYAFKPNNSLAICQILQQAGAAADVASLGEYLLATKAGYSPHKMIFTGPGKTKIELEKTIKSGIEIIVAESITEVMRINEIAKQNNIIQKILLRVNTNYCATESGIKLGGGCQKFGIDEEKIQDACSKITKMKYVHFAGIHAISGSLIIDFKVLLEGYRYAINLVNRLEEQNIHIEVIDFGGGMGIPYSLDGEEFDIESFAAEVELLFNQQKNKYRYICEIGRYLVGEFGAYVTTVIDMKMSRGKKFIIVDGGTHHILRQYLQWANNFAHVVPTIPRKTSLDRVSVGGPLCTPSDLLIQDAMLPTVQRDDLLIIQNTGAYSISTGTSIFSGHPLPAEIIDLNGKFYTIRDGGQYEDILNNQRDITKYIPKIGNRKGVA